jgi:solute carrier family 45 protein 1/2/4
VIGCVICVLSLLIFGYTREVASVVTTWGSDAVSYHDLMMHEYLHSDRSTLRVQHATLTIWLAVFAVYALDFAINGVQATDRALIVDVLPVSQQEEANAWVARL